MALVVGENTYMSLADIQEFIDDRDIDLVIDEPEVHRAMDYLLSLNWIEDPDMDDADDAVKKALCYAVMMEAEMPGILAPQTHERIKSESVHGAVSVEYESGGSKQEYTVINRLLRGLISSSNILLVELS